MQDEGVRQETQAAPDSLGGQYRPDGALPVLSGGVQNPNHGKGWAAPVPRLPRADHHARRGRGAVSVSKYARKDDGPCKSRSSSWWTRMGFPTSCTILTRKRR